MNLLHQVRLPAVLLFLALSAGLHAGFLFCIPFSRPTCPVKRTMKIWLGGGRGMAAPKATHRDKSNHTGRTRERNAKKRHVPKADRRPKTGEVRQGSSQAHASLAKGPAARHPKRHPSRHKKGMRKQEKRGAGKTRASAFRKQGRNPAKMHKASASAAGNPLPSLLSPRKRQGSETERQGIRDYMALVRARIEARKRYPWNARNLGWQGKTVLSFSIDATGALHSLQIVRGSGFGLLDHAALKAVRDAAPFPPPPPALLSPTKIRVTLRFSLSGT